MKTAKLYDIEYILPAKADPNQGIEAHRHISYEFFIFEEGEGLHSIDFKDYEIKPFSMQLVCPHQLHMVRRSPDSRGLVILMEEEVLEKCHVIKRFLSRVPYNFNFQQCIEIEATDNVLIKQLVTQLEQNPNEHLFLALAQYLIYCFSRQSINTTVELTAEQSVFIEFIDLVEQHYLHEKSANFYCQSLQLSLRKLNTIVEQQTGMSVKKFLIYRILLEAKRMLMHGNFSVKKIAFELEFLEPSHFSSFFKKHLGVSPSDFVSRYWQ